MLLANNGIWHPVPHFFLIPKKIDQLTQYNEILISVNNNHEKKTEISAQRMGQFYRVLLVQF